MAGDCNVYALFAMNAPIIRMVNISDQVSMHTQNLWSDVLEVESDATRT